MPELTHLLAVVAVAATVTWALRALPFAVLVPLRRSTLLAFLGERLPLGVMLILLVYMLRDLDVTVPRQVLPAAIALTVTLAVHRWRGSMVQALVAGTATHVLLVSLWPV